jgi:hypothetical protein
LLAFTTLPDAVFRPLAALSTLAACSSVIARDGLPGFPAGRSISSITFRPMRSWTCARRIDLRSVLLIMTSERLLRNGAICRKNLSASVALKFLSFLAPIRG